MYRVDVLRFQLIERLDLLRYRWLGFVCSVLGHRDYDWQTVYYEEIGTNPAEDWRQCSRCEKVEVGR